MLFSGICVHAAQGVWPLPTLVPQQNWPPTSSQAHDKLSALIILGLCPEQNILKWWFIVESKT